MLWIPSSWLGGALTSLKYHLRYYATCEPEQPPWNRRTRRTHARAKGVISSTSFVDQAPRNGMGLEETPLFGFTWTPCWAHNTAYTIHRSGPTFGGQLPRERWQRFWEVRRAAQCRGCEMVLQDQDGFEAEEKTDGTSRTSRTMSSAS